MTYPGRALQRLLTVFTSGMAGQMSSRDGSAIM